MEELEITGRLRHDYPEIVQEYIDTQPVWGYRFSFNKPLGHLALDMASLHLSEQLEVSAARFVTLEAGSIESHTILDMLVRGMTARAANQNAERVAAPLTHSRLETGVSIIGVKPLMPEQAMELFDSTESRIPSIDREFSVMMDPTIL